MKKITILCMLCMPAFGDELVMTDGQKIEWKILEDKGDAYLVTPLRGPKVTVKKSEIREVKVSKFEALLTGATFTTEDGKMTIEKAQGKPIDLLSSIDPKKNLTPGNNGKSTAEFKDGKDLQVEATPDRYARLEIPIALPLEYDLTLVLERPSGGHPIYMGLSSGQKQWLMSIGGWFDKNGLFLVDKKEIELSKERSGESRITDGTATLVYYVRAGGFVTTLNGKEVFTWQGDYKRMSLPQEWTQKKPGALFIGMSESRVLFKSIILVPFVQKK